MLELGLNNQIGESKKNRGFFGIGIYHPKTSINIGTLWRSAFIFGANFIFTIGRRYRKQASDTQVTYRHVPLFHYKSIEDFLFSSPYHARLICVEISNDSFKLNDFVHPDQAVYILGAEDYGLPDNLLRGHQVVTISTDKEICLNVATAGSIIMYDRFIKRGKG